jgi:hypothetical protein
MPRRLLALVLAAASLVALPASAAAVTIMPINPWRVVSERSGLNLDEAGAARAGNGVLHVVYPDVLGPSEEGIRYRTLSLGGTWSAPETVVGSWESHTNPDVELIAGVPHVFFGGIATTDTSDPASSGQAWYATRADGTWTRSASPFSALSTAYASSEFSTALAVDGTPWGTWTGTFGLRVHTGLATGSSEPTLSDGCCDYASNVGRDAKTGEIWAFYYSNADAGEGYFTQRVAPTLGARTLLPGGRYQDQALSRTKRMAAAPRTTGGVYSAYCDRYPSCTGIRVGAADGTGLRLAPVASPNAETVWAAAAPFGRMWVSWADAKGVWVARSNKAFTQWGARQLIGGPRNWDSIWQTSGDGSRGPLDLLANITVNDDTRIWHRRVQPKLSVATPAGLVHSDMSRTIMLRLTDAGDPVVGKISFLGVSHTTNALGYATVTVPAGTRTGAHVATGTASGYVAGTGRVRVHRM